MIYRIRFLIAMQFKADVSERSSAKFHARKCFVRDPCFNITEMSAVRTRTPVSPPEVQVEMPSTTLSMCNRFERSIDQLLKQ